MNKSAILVGVFVGGRGSRLGGVNKGLLKAPSSELTLVERLRDEALAALGDVEVVLVGSAAAYASYQLHSVEDAPAALGPIGGLGGLLLHAAREGAASVLALACDLPFLSAPLLARLAAEAPEAAALVTHEGGVRNPLIARYDVALTSAALRRVVTTGRRSLQAVLDELGDGVHLLSLSAAETATLADWDTPEDVNR